LGLPNLSFAIAGLFIVTPWNLAEDSSFGFPFNGRQRTNPRLSESFAEQLKQACE
jgi:hypothetical protein